MTMPDGQMARPVAEQFLAAWRTVDGKLSDLPGELRPANLAHAYAIQEAVNRELGAIGGWRICHAALAAALACTPLPLGTIHVASLRLTCGCARAQPVMCLRVGRNLPDYDAPFTAQQVSDAIEAAALGAEVLEPRMDRASSADGLVAIADSCGYRALVHSRSVSTWRNPACIDLAITTATGRKRRTVRRSTAVTAVIEPLRWLANDGARWGGGLQVGQLVVIALQTEELRVEPGMTLRLAADGLGPVTLQITGAAGVRGPAARPRGHPL